MPLTGQSIIAGSRPTARTDSSRAIDPSTGDELDPEFVFIGEADLDRASAAAAAAFDEYRQTTQQQRAAFLETIASNLDNHRDEIVARARLETGLTLRRLESEHGRTTAQL